MDVLQDHPTQQAVEITGFCRLVEGVPTNTAAVANHSSMHNSISE